MGNSREQASRNAIQKALIELLNVYTIDKITVSNLAIHANVNRSTFYAHYDSVYSVLDEIEMQLLNTTRNFVSLSPNNSRLNTLKLLQFIHNNGELFYILFTKCSPSQFNNNFLKISAEVLESDFDIKGDQTTRPYMIEFLIRGNNALIHRWINHNFDISVELLCDIMTKLSKSIVQTD